jgi:spore germination protein GerM
MAKRSSASRPSSRGGGSSAGGKPGIGCLVWLVLLLATLLLFVLNWDRIQDTLRATRFSEAIESLDEPARTAPGRGGDGSAAPAAETPASPGGAPAGSASPAPGAASPSGERQPAGTAPQPAPVAPGPGQTQSPPAQTPPSTTAPVEAMARTRIVSLYFVRVDGDGTINRQEVKRTIDASDSPLTDALGALLKGPSADELGRNLITLIPSGTQLLSAQVRGSTAYLDFNEAFMINRYGIEGYAGQLKQIVYTATSFSTVKDVQFLIEGERREFLGGEGVYIGRPLSRSSF